MNKLKVLFVANITKHILRFHLPYLQWFQENGYETHVAANGNEKIPYCDIKFNLPLERSPFSISNLHAHKQLKKIITENNYVLVHGHTPMGGVLARTASIESRKNGTKVLYTAHGFHFFKGGSFKNWLLYYPVEKFLSKYTDAIITINSEDFDLLVDKKFKALHKFKINGIGVNNLRFQRVSNEEKIALRKLYDYDENDFILIYVAEFIDRKNHKFILDSINKIKLRIPQLKIILAGRGLLLEEMKNYSRKIQIDTFVDFLGFRSDIDKLIQLSDVGISSSKQEGLGLNIAEEMFCGLPIVATIDRGHKELVEHGRNGFLFEQNNHIQYEKQVIELFENKVLRKEMGECAYSTVQKFSLTNSLKSMEEIYKQFL